jgi:hypothetical protein
VWWRPTRYLDLEVARWFLPGCLSIESPSAGRARLLFIASLHDTPMQCNPVQRMQCMQCMQRNATMGCSTTVGVKRGRHINQECPRLPIWSSEMAKFLGAVAISLFDGNAGNNHLLWASHERDGHFFKGGGRRSWAIPCQQRITPSRGLGAKLPCDNGGRNLTINLPHFTVGPRLRFAPGLQQFTVSLYPLLTPLMQTE